MTTSRGLRLAVSALATAGAVLLGTAAPAAPPTTPVPTGRPSCDPIDPTACLLPFPNDYFTVPDRTTPTGRRVPSRAGAMPAERRGNPDRPDRVEPATTGSAPARRSWSAYPGLDAEASGIAPVTDIGRSLATTRRSCCSTPGPVSARRTGPSWTRTRRPARPAAADHPAGRGAGGGHPLHRRACATCGTATGR